MTSISSTSFATLWSSISGKLKIVDLEHFRAYWIEQCCSEDHSSSKLSIDVLGQEFEVVPIGTANILISMVRSSLKLSLQVSINDAANLLSILHVGCSVPPGSS